LRIGCRHRAAVGEAACDRGGFKLDAIEIDTIAAGCGGDQAAVDDGAADGHSGDADDEGVGRVVAARREYGTAVGDVAGQRHLGLDLDPVLHGAEAAGVG
jgi:hypothetical protein